MSRRDWRAVLCKRLPIEARLGAGNLVILYQSHLATDQHRKEKKKGFSDNADLVGCRAVQADSYPTTRFLVPLTKLIADRGRAIMKV